MQVEASLRLRRKLLVQSTRPWPRTRLHRSHSTAQIRPRPFTSLAAVVLGSIMMLPFESGCHSPLSLTAPKTTNYAPIYTEGPVPLPGQDFSVAQVTATDGDPIVIPSVRPGASMAFPISEPNFPQRVFIRVHVEEGAAPQPDAEIWTMEPVLRIQGRGKRKKTVVGFSVPQLPRGNYDVWYEGEQPGSPDETLLASPSPVATQWTTIEVRPQLEPLHSVVHGTPGSIVEVAVRLHGPVPEGVRAEVRLSGFSEGVRLGQGQRNRVVTDSSGLARFKVQVEDGADMYLAATAAGYQPTAIRVVVGEEHPLRDHRLRPGDILLCQGGSLIISPAIMLVERMQLGLPNPLGRPWYSHAALYLGGDRTAEMLDPGLVVSTLTKTASECTTLDVYRRGGITDKEQNRVVKHADYGELPYAWGQIAAMASMAVVAGKSEVHLQGPPSWFESFVGVIRSAAATVIGWVVREATQFVMGEDDGRLAMICSEFVSWSYHDASIPLDVAPWWPIVKDAGLLRTLDGRMDYTTPNMIAQSPDLTFQFQLYPEVPPQVSVESCEVRLGEKIEFETGSAEVDDRDVDLLEAVLGVLTEHGEIEHLRIEGYTDDIGTAKDNMDLSQQRANAVMNWLIEHGVEASRASGVGFGETRPLMPNESPKSRHMNRRVEFHVASQQCERHIGRAPPPPP